VKARILVASNPTNKDCRTGVCQHNENTDLTRWHGAIYLVHRTANSQILGPNSSLRVYRSRDEGKTFKLQAIIPAPAGRDIRDPCFFVVGKRLFIKAITPAAGLCVARPGRRIDHGPDAFLRRPQVVSDACHRPSRVGVLARGQARRGV
jgi:hypothetical protein